MKYTRLKGTNLSVSHLGLGCEPLGGTDWGNVNTEKILAAVQRAYELGITYFDTADVYGLGRSEKLLAQALGPHRHDVVIGTKFGVNWHEPEPGQRAEVFYDNSPKRVIEALENSLQRMKLDAIPLYFIHWPDPNTPLEDTLAALARCKDAGKIRAIGLSNFSAKQISAASEIVDIAAVQVQYNLIDRKVETDIFRVCKALAVSVFAYGVLAQGLLTGKYDLASTFGKDDRRHRLPHFQLEQRSDNQKYIERLKKIARTHKKGIPQVAIRWVSENSNVACVIVGAKTPAQVVSNCGSVGWNLNQKEREYLKQNHGEK